MGGHPRRLGQGEAPGAGCSFTALANSCGGGRLGLNPSFRPASPPASCHFHLGSAEICPEPAPPGSPSPGRRRMFPKDRKQIYFLLFSPHVNNSLSFRESPSRGKGAQRSTPPPSPPLRFTGGETRRPNRIRKALVSFLVGVIKSINWLCRQLKMTGVAKKPSLIFPSVPSGGGKRAGGRSRLFTRGPSRLRSGDYDDATAHGTARPTPSGEK